MMSDTGNRPSPKGGTTGEKTDENRGGATRGPAGAIRRTRNTAPGATGPDLIRAVALRARRDDVDPAEVWRSIRADGDEVAARFELSNSIVTIQASPVGLVARVEHDHESVEYALLADETARALAEVAGDGGGGA